MAGRLICCQGLPASGKSSWALERVAKNPGATIRVNRDDIRAMVHGSTKWSKAKEKTTKAIRDALIRTGLEAGLVVICDDTNIQPGVIDHLKNIAKAHGAAFEIKDFTDVSVEECIKRDLARDRTVGETVIRVMWNDYLKPDMRVSMDESLPRCVIFDMDGTLALMHNRGPFEYEKCGDDLPNPMVVALAQTYHEQGYEIVVCSGREGTAQCRADTKDWLNKHDITYSALFMREEGDMRKDAIVKREILERDIIPQYFVVLAVDDRRQVVDGWRDAGVECWQVAPGEF
jgi:predicted kinase